MGVAVAPEVSAVESASQPPALPLGRWIASGTLLLGEYLAVSLAFDVQPLKADAAWIGWAGDAAGVVLVAVTAIVALARAPGSAALADLRARIFPLPSMWAWGLAHVAAATALFTLSAVVSRGAQAPTGGAAWLPGAWAAAVVAVVATGIGIAIPGRAGVVVAKLAARPAATGLLAGALAWLLARASEGVWPWFSRITMTAAAALLSLLASTELVVDVERLYLGLGDFVVEISAACSGIQGMGLMAALTTAYVVRFRHGLRLPRALVIVPVGIVLAFAFNIVRIAALVWVGARISPDVAMGGFHSKAGWLATCLLALGLVFWVRRSPSLSIAARADAEHRRVTEAENAAAAYLVPLLVNLALILVTGAVVASFDLLYPVRVLLVGGVLAWWHPWKRLATVPSTVQSWRPSAIAVLLGVAVVPLWLLLVHPSPGGDAHFANGLAALPPGGRATWLAARVLGATLLVPVIEELAFRGFLLRRLHAADFDRVSYTAAVRPVPLVASAAAFGALHSSFVAGTIAGLAYGLALIPRGRLLDAVAAHAVTNAILIGYALMTSSWYLIA